MILLHQFQTFPSGEKNEILFDASFDSQATYFDDVFDPKKRVYDNDDIHGAQFEYFNEDTEDDI